MTTPAEVGLVYLVTCPAEAGLTDPHGEVGFTQLVTYVAFDIYIYIYIYIYKTRYILP